MSRKENGRITTPIKCHGGKHYLAERIVVLMASHRHFVDLTFGGGSVLLAKDPEGVSEVVNDLDERLINFWRVLQSREGFKRFQREVEAIPFSEGHWRRSHEFLSDRRNTPAVCPVTHAVHFFVYCRQSLAGRMGSFAPLSRSRTRRGMNEQASAWLSSVDGLQLVHERMRRVVILNRPALEVVKSQDGKETLFYWDPPYVHSTRLTTREYREYEMSDEDHRQLLAVLVNVRGKFVLSGYRCKMYDDFARERKWVRHDFTIANHAAGGGSKRRMTESVWCNYG